MPLIYSPIPPVLTEQLELAQRPPGLAGTRVSVVDNSKSNAGRLLSSVVDVLVRKHGAVRGIAERKPYSAIPATPKALARLAAESDLVLTASADCGSCTSGCVQDTVALERLGVPSILLGTDAFAPLAGQLATWFGLESMRRVTTSHPLGGITEDEVDKKAAEVARVIAAEFASSGGAAATVG